MLVLLLASEVYLIALVITSKSLETATRELSKTLLLLVLSSLLFIIIFKKLKKLDTLSSLGLSDGFGNSPFVSNDDRDTAVNPTLSIMSTTSSSNGSLKNVPLSLFYKRIRIRMMMMMIRHD